MNAPPRNEKAVMEELGHRGNEREVPAAPFDVLARASSISCAMAAAMIIWCETTQEKAERECLARGFGGAELLSSDFFGG